MKIIYWLAEEVSASQEEVEVTSKYVHILPAAERLLVWYSDGPQTNSDWTAWPHSC